MSSKSDKALVVAGGYPPPQQFLQEHLRQAAFVAAADSGARYVIEAGFCPDVSIGDFDSLEREILDRLCQQGCRIIKLPVEKDQTDLEAALDYCIQQGFRQIEVAAALSGQRIDHLLGTIILLPKYLGQKARVRLVAEKGRFAEVIDREICFSGRVGTYVSLLPLTPQVLGVTTTGLKYPLDNGTLVIGSTLGVSNQMAAPSARVTLQKGLLLVVKEADC